MKATSHDSWLKMKLLSQLVQHSHSDGHLAFLELLESMMKTDPRKRPGAQECLKHRFF
jgi:hypothetical protein